MINVEINTKDLEAVMRSMPSVMKVVMEDALAYAGNKFMKQWHQERFQGGEGIQEHDKAHGLFSRFNKTVTKDGGDMALKISAKNKVAYKLETGYTATGAPGRRIPVPLTFRRELYTSNGALNRRYRSAAAFVNHPNFVPIKFKGQYYFTDVKRKHNQRTLVRRFMTGKSYRTKDELTPLFVLKDKVVVKPRLGFYMTFSKMHSTLWNILAQRLIRGVKQEWSKGEVSFAV